MTREAHPSYKSILGLSLSCSSLSCYSEIMVQFFSYHKNTLKFHKNVSAYQISDIGGRPVPWADLHNAF